MSDACPAPGPDDPLVRSLLGAVDCNVQELVRGGYDALFQPSGAFAGVLTVLLTLYVALIGYQLLLGRSQLNITDFALTAVKLGAIVALATQWGAYQSLVYHFLFYGPQQIADVIVHDFRARGSTFTGDVFDGLQRAFADLTSFSPATPPGAPAPIASVGGPLGPGGTAGTGALSTLLSKAGFDSLLLLFSAVVLLVSSLGVLLASKIVLGMLLATGPIFIAMLLFDATRGVFEGWLRACLAFAFAPLAVTLMLGVAMTLLEPWLQQIETMRETSTYLPGVAFGVMVLVMVFAGVAIGIVAAAAAIATGLKLPGRRVAAPSMRGAAAATTVVHNAFALPARANRTAAAVTAQERREALLFAPAPAAAAVRLARAGKAKALW
ncbi:MAG TPA: type IV secretion system protein, partial [Caulobacteraceae bacterium]|nr:type IV secretion system protein [Caulobacteraceae bacterium]